MDIIPAFEAVVPGSNPGGCTHEKANLFAFAQGSKDFSLFYEIK